MKKQNNENEKKEKRLPIVVRVLIALVAIILVIAIAGASAFLILQNNGKKSLIVNKPETPYEETITHNGHTYVYDKNKVAFAFFGVDKEKFGLQGDLVGTAGQADADIVGVVDTNTGNIDIITIPRDTMVDVDLYNKDGTFVRTEKMQLCLSYAYGDGKEKSCSQVTTAMSRILLNVPIEKYFVLDVAGIAPLNDAIGGVTVQSLYSIPHMGIEKGKSITLKGDMAEAYVRTRDMDNVNASLNRTERQMQYIKGYAGQLIPAVKNDFSTVSRLYNTAMKYSQTNVSLDEVTYIASLALQKGVTGFTQHKLDGEMKASDKKISYTGGDDYVFAEFYPNDEALLETVLECFYKQVD